MRIKFLRSALFSTTLMVMALMTSVAQAIPATGAWYQPRSGDHKPLIMAHQGGEGEYPSNVKLAFTQAHNAGVDALDTDMFATANTAPAGQPSNSELVLFHDETLDSRTNCTGPISSRDYNYLYQNCNFAYNWTPDGGATFPYRNSTDPNATKVVKVSELLDAFPNDRIGLEIKQTTAQAATDLCTLIKAKHAEDRMLISSFAQANMDVFRAACPTVATSATQDEGVQFYIYSQSTFPPGFNPPYSSLQVPEFFSGIQVITPDTVGDAHSFGLKVYAWTIDKPVDAARLIQVGVDGLNSSYPKRIMDWLKTYLKPQEQRAVTTPDGCQVKLEHGNFGSASYSQMYHEPGQLTCQEGSYVQLLSLKSLADGSKKWASQRCYISATTTLPGDGACQRYGSPGLWYQANMGTSTVVGSRWHLCGDTAACDTNTNPANNPQYAGVAPDPMHGEKITQSKGNCSVTFMHGDYGTTAFSQMMYSPASGACNTATSFVELTAIDAQGNLHTRKCPLSGNGSGTAGACSTWADQQQLLYNWYQANIPNHHIVGSTVRLCDDNVVDPCDDFYHSGF